LRILIQALLDLLQIGIDYVGNLLVDRVPDVFGLFPLFVHLAHLVQLPYQVFSFISQELHLLFHIQFSVLLDDLDFIIEEDLAALLDQLKFLSAAFHLPLDLV